MDRPEVQLARLPLCVEWSGRRLSVCKGDGTAECSFGGAQNVSVASEVDDRLQLRYGLQLITLMGCS